MKDKNQFSDFIKRHITSILTGAVVGFSNIHSYITADTNIFPITAGRDLVSEVPVKNLKNNLTMAFTCMTTCIGVFLGCALTAYISLNNGIVANTAVPNVAEFARS